MKAWLIIHDKWLEEGYYRDLYSNLSNMSVVYSLEYKQHNPYRKLEQELNADITFLHDTDNERTDFYRSHKTESNYWVIFSGGFEGFQTLSSNRIRIAGDILVQNIENFISDFVKNKKPDFRILGASSLAIPLSNLKHAIAHCFLSIDVDIQGISAAWSEGKNESKEYFTEVLWGKENEVYANLKSEGYYLGRLRDAREYAGLFGNRSDNINKIIQESELPNDNQWWKYIKQLLGDERTDGELNSPIYPLFDSLDILLKEGIGKCRNEQYDLLDNKGMQSFVEYFGDLQRCWNERRNIITPWEFNECFEKLIGKKEKYSFHDWFIALNDGLDKLREDYTKLMLSQ